MFYSAAHNMLIYDHAEPARIVASIAGAKQVHELVNNMEI